MGQRQAQEFWDQMWYWERYESYPGEDIDDPHLVIILGSQVDAAKNAGQQPDPDVFRRFDASTGRVLDRLTNLFPRSGDQIDLAELKLWFEFGLNAANRGHDGVPIPIIDANSLLIFLLFARYAREFCVRHTLGDLGTLWTQVEATAQEVEDNLQRRGVIASTSRFAPR